MRHGKKVNHLGRTSSHRKAMLSNMASSLILSKRITTTVAKAKALRKYVEPLITKAKDDSMHSRRTVFAYLQNKESVKELFGTVAGRTSERPGGYTRIIKMGDVRLGDNAEMCLIELVDFNDIYKKEGEAKKAKTRRGRTKAKKAEETEGAVETPVAEKPAKKATKKKEKGSEETE
jgi:large subunit ribosomal protein L17